MGILAKTDGSTWSNVLNAKIKTNAGWTTCQGVWVKTSANTWSQLTGMRDNIPVSLTISNTPNVDMGAGGTVMLRSITVAPGLTNCNKLNNVQFWALNPVAVNKTHYIYTSSYELKPTKYGVYNNAENFRNYIYTGVSFSVSSMGTTSNPIVYNLGNLTLNAKYNIRNLLIVPADWRDMSYRVVGYGCGGSIMGYDYTYTATTPPTYGFSFSTGEADMVHGYDWSNITPTIIGCG